MSSDEVDAVADLSEVRDKDWVRAATDFDSGSAPAKDVAAGKKALRGQIRAQRKARRREQDEHARRLEAESIARGALAHLDSCPQAHAAGWDSPTATVAAFRSTPSEPDTSALLDALHARGVRVLVPRTQADLSLDWHQLLPPEQRNSERGEPAAAAPEASSAQTPGDAELPGDDNVADEGPALGLDAVAEISAMILPGLAVDADGHRLGQGGGCYDRTLPRMQPETCRAVLLFDAEIVPAVPATEHDQRVPAVLTPEAGWRDLTA